MKSNLSKLLKKLSDIVFPDGYACLICDKEIIPNRYCICEDCEIIRNEQEFCLKCGTPVGTAADYCDDCRLTEYAFDRARSALIYNDNLHNALYGLKYGNDEWSAKYLAAFMADSYYKLGLDADIIVPVPLFPSKEKKRGYNQCQALGSALSEYIGVPMVTDALIRVKDTDDQASLSKAARIDNVKNAFDKGESAVIKGKNVLLLDDVITTGATVNECALILKRMRAASVTAFSLATPRKN